jgi:hypothetical protein
MTLNPYFKRGLTTVLVSLATLLAHSQTNLFWNTTGNAATSSNWLGTSNNEPLIFKTNDVEALRIKSNGNIQISVFQNQGKGLVWANNNGVLNFTAFPNDTNQIYFVRTLQGQTVFTNYSVSDQSIILDLSFLSSGVYLVTVLNEFYEHTECISIVR